MDSSVFHRRLGFAYPVAVSAEGVRIKDADGKTYIDGVSGAVVCSLGYGDADITAAIKRQIDTIAYVHSSAFTSEAVERLAEKLVGYQPASFAKAYFVSGGSEATEAALKMARQYAVAIGEPQRTCVISRRNSYHGNTLGALSVSGNIGRRKIYEPIMARHVLTSRCYAYRDQSSGQSTDEYCAMLLEDFRQTIEGEGPETVLAFIAEPVVGASLGAVPAVAGYYRAVREMCDHYGILLILDEVMCGIGRTGSMFAFEQESVRPDLLLLAKGLGAGYQPIGAVLASGRVVDGIARRGGQFEHGHTYMCHATAAAAALAVLQKIDSARLLDKVRADGSFFQGTLGDLLAGHPNVGDIRGRGLMWGVEFVADRESKAPLDPQHRFSERLKQAAMDVGLICYPVGGFLDGTRGDVALLAPPFIATRADLEEIAEKFARAAALAGP